MDKKQRYNLSRVLEEVKVERLRQHACWGEQNFTPENFLPILIEEVGEVGKAIYEQKKDNYRRELIEVAAVACQMIESFDRNKEAK